MHSEPVATIVNMGQQLILTGVFAQPTESNSVCYNFRDIKQSQNCRFHFPKSKSVKQKNVLHYLRSFIAVQKARCFCFNWTSRWASQHKRLCEKMILVSNSCPKTMQGQTQRGTSDEQYWKLLNQLFLCFHNTLSGNELSQHAIVQRYKFARSAL